MLVTGLNDQGLMCITISFSIGIILTLLYNFFHSFYRLKYSSTHYIYCLKTAGWFEFEYKQCSCGEAISKTGYKGKTQRLMSLTMPCKFFTCFAYKYALCFDNVYDDNQNGKDSPLPPHK